MMKHVNKRQNIITLSWVLLVVVTLGGLVGCGQKVALEPEGKTTQSSRQY